MAAPGASKQAGWQPRSRRTRASAQQMVLHLPTDAPFPFLHDWVQISELRAIELLEGLCDGMRSYTLITANTTTADGRASRVSCWGGAGRLLLLQLHIARTATSREGTKPGCAAWMEPRRPSTGRACTTSRAGPGGRSSRSRPTSRNSWRSSAAGALLEGAGPGAVGGPAAAAFGFFRCALFCAATDGRNKCDGRS